MRRAIVLIIVCQLKLRVMIWRAGRCLRPFDRLSSPLSVMLGQLIIRANETSQSYHYSLPVELESNRLKSCKAFQTLR